MSDEEFDEESFRAYENELYGETSSDSEEGIDSEIEEALYSQVHYSFSLPNEEDLEEKDAGADLSNDSQTLLDSKQRDEKEVQDDLNESDDEESAEKIEYIVIDDESCSSIDDNSGKNSNKEGNSENDDDKDDGDDDNSGKVMESTQENWSLIEEDLQTDLLADGKRRPVSRYYKKDGNLRCHNCNEKGHKAVDCPTPKKISCFLCGGEHIRRRCPNELCFNCHEPGHRVMNCKKPRSRHDDQCRRCFMLGHHSKDCPDRWRQYHRTTDSTKHPVVNRSGAFAGPVYCYNCSEEGHYGHECIHDRMDNYLTPTYPFVVKYDGNSEDRQDNRILQDKRRKRTKTHDGATGQFKEEVSEKAKKRQRRKEERQSWPNQSHGRHDSRRMEEFEEDNTGGSNTQEGRVVQYIERISERTKKRQRGKNKRNSWSGQSHDRQQSNDDIAIHSSHPHDRKGSTSKHFEDANEVKIGSKRRHSGTPYHDEAKKGKHTEHKTNKQKKKKKKEKGFQPASYDERIVELVNDDEIYGNDYQTSQQLKATNKKFNKRRESGLPDTSTRMVEDMEHRHSSPGYAHSTSHSSPAYDRRESQGSSNHRQSKKFKRSSREYDGKHFNNSRGFRSKWQ